MDSQQFDRLVQALASGVSRRRALRGLGAVALGGVGAASLQGASARGCAVCQKKKNGRCKPRRFGSPCNAGGSCCTPKTCCNKGTACNNGVCGACQTNTDPCNNGVQVCGYFGPDPQNDWCMCLTSVQNANTCTSFFGDCASCTTDQQCTDLFGGAPSVCVDLSHGCGICDGSGGQPNTGGKVCVAKGCQDFSSAGASAARSGGAEGLQRIPGLRPSS